MFAYQNGSIDDTEFALLYDLKKMRCHCKDTNIDRW